MTDETTSNQDIYCILALEAAISNSADVSGETGVLLRRTISVFGAFATRLEEEAANSTKEQLEKTLRSMDNFQIAFNETRNSIERRINLNCIAGDSEEMKSATEFVDDEIKEEELLDYDMIEPKYEPLDGPLSIPEYQPFGHDFLGDEIKKEDIMNDNMIEPNERPIHAPLSDDQNFGTNLIGDGMPYKDEPLEEDVFNSKSVMKNNEYSKETSTEKNELECPECEYHSRSANAWWIHLKEKHSTTPTLAGCLLRCECGHESYSHAHSYECKISNFTIIRKGDGPIRRMQMTPQCVLCKIHPKTTRGYIYHLTRHHKTTLKKNGIYLICACGIYYTTQGDYKKHDKKCSGNEFSLHKLDKD